MNWVIYEIYGTSIPARVNGDLVWMFFHFPLQTADSFITEFEVSDCPGPSPEKRQVACCFLQNWNQLSMMFLVLAILLAMACGLFLRLHIWLPHWPWHPQSNIQSKQDHGIRSHYCYRWGKPRKQADYFFLGSEITAWHRSHENEPTLTPWKKQLTNQTAY